MRLAEIVLIKEGGYALKDAGVGRVKKEDIPATVQLVSQITGIPAEDLHPLGSVGKMPDSGDIDLGVDVNKFNPEEIHQKMCNELGDDMCTYNKGTKVASYGFPIAGDPEKGLVQVDLMYVDNPSWATFSYHSPGMDSKYKGAIRAMLLMGVAATYEEPGTDHFEYDPTSGDLIIRAGRTLDLNSGMRRIFQFRPKSKKGDKYLKSMKTISLSDFKEMFPDVEVSGDEITIDDPKKVLTILFGGKVAPKDVHTAEQVIDLIKDRFDEERQDAIFKKAADRARSAVGKMDIPPEMMEYLQ